MKNDYCDMDLVIKERWRKALLSGEYQQHIFERMRHEDNGKFTFSALGVLCDIFQKETGRKVNWWRREIPRSVREWAGLHASAIYISTPTPLENPQGRTGKLLLCSRQYLEEHWRSYGWSETEILHELGCHRYWRTLQEWSVVWQLKFSDIAFLLEFGTIDGFRKWKR